MSTITACENHETTADKNRFAVRLAYCTIQLRMRHDSHLNLLYNLLINNSLLWNGTLNAFVSMLTSPAVQGARSIGCSACSTF